MKCFKPSLEDILYKKYKKSRSYLYEPKSLIPHTPFTPNVNMTRICTKKTTDWLHCTYSAIIDTFEMENNRQPEPHEINDIILAIGANGTIAK